MDNRYYQLRNDIGGAAARYVDQLDQDGQIDRDGNTDPYVTGFEKVPGSNLVRINIARNGTQQSVVINPKSRSLRPERQTFDVSDNWKRPEAAPQKITPPQAVQKGPKGERERRPAMAQQPTQKPAVNPSSQAGAPQIREAAYAAVLRKLLGV